MQGKGHAPETRAGIAKAAFASLDSDERFCEQAVIIFTALSNTSRPSVIVMRVGSKIEIPMERGFLRPAGIWIARSGSVRIDSGAENAPDPGIAESGAGALRSMAWPDARLMDVANHLGGREKTVNGWARLRVASVVRSIESNVRGDSSPACKAKRCWVTSLSAIVSR